MKTIFLTLFTSLFTTLLFAQAPDGLSIGARGGVNFANITSTDDLEDPEMRTAYYIGILAEFPVSRMFSVQTEVNYSAQGFSIDEFAEYQVDYLQIPVLAKVYLIPGLNAYAGPQIGYKVNEEADFEENTANLIDSVESDAVNDLDLSAVLGAQYKLSNGLFIEGRYNLGLSNVFDEDGNLGNVSEDDIRNSVISLGIGFIF